MQVCNKRRLVQGTQKGCGGARRSNFFTKQQCNTNTKALDPPSLAVCCKGAVRRRDTTGDRWRLRWSVARLKRMEVEEDGGAVVALIMRVWRGLFEHRVCNRLF